MKKLGNILEGSMTMEQMQAWGTRSACLNGNEEDIREKIPLRRQIRTESISVQTDKEEKKQNVGYVYSQKPVKMVGDHGGDCRQELGHGSTSHSVEREFFELGCHVGLVSVALASSSRVLR